MEIVKSKQIFRAKKCGECVQTTPLHRTQLDTFLYSFPIHLAM